MRMRWAAAILALQAAIRPGSAQPVEVVSSLGPAVESQAREAVERAKSDFAALGLTLRKPNLPTQVILLPTVVELAPYVGAGVGRSRAFSFAGADRNYIVLAWTAPGSAARAAAHEYAHLVDPVEAAPIWFREGFAEYLSYFERDEEGRLIPAAPARHVVRLRDSRWLAFERLWAAARRSEDFQAPTFYAQSWLAVHWLASRGRPPQRLRAEDMRDALRDLGPEGVEAALRAHFETFDVLPAEQHGQTAAPAAAPGGAWRLRLALTEVDRELGRRERAGAELEALQAERPGAPDILAALGALAMDEGRYDEAETLLDKAAADPGATARTHYRFALMLLRPVGLPARERAESAARHARQALDRSLDASDYRLTLAHALMVGEHWEAAASELNRLAQGPHWRERAEEEMAELLRRRQQALSAVARPAAPRSPQAAHVDPGPLQLAALPPPPKPAPPPPMRWPPPGAHILAGRVDFVDCRGPEKIIVMRHPLLTLRIREPKGKPAKLFYAPQKHWTEIPCGAKGWTVNIAYYPYRNRTDILGDAAAILF